MPFGSPRFQGRGAPTGIDPALERPTTHVLRAVTSEPVHGARELPCRREIRRVRYEPCVPDRSRFARLRKVGAQAIERVRIALGTSRRKGAKERDVE